MRARMSLRRLRVTATSMALAFAVVGAACGGDEEEPAATAKATTAATAKAATSAATAATTKATGTAAATATPKAAATTGATAGATTILVRETSLGKVLTDANGLTLYTFKNDPVGEGKSVCNGNCASIWPPLAAPAGGSASKPADAAGALTEVTRDDGSKMLAYNGQPLYRYQPDTAPGETKGEGVGGVWSVARP